MNLEILTARAQEIDNAIATTVNQMNALQGHKAEIAHWISQLPAVCDESEVDQPAVNPDESPVE